MYLSCLIAVNLFMFIDLQDRIELFLKKEALITLCYFVVLAMTASIAYPNLVAAQNNAKIYGNNILGFSLQYPHTWTINTYDKSDCLKFDSCYIILIVAPPTNTSVISIRVQNLSSVDLFACLCKTLHDYVAWNYKWNDNFENISLLNNNQTTVNMNHTAWQAEIYKNHESSKSLIVFAINDNSGYMFDYSVKDANVYNEYLSDFRGILRSIKFLSTS